MTRARYTQSLTRDTVCHEKSLFPFHFYTVMELNVSLARDAMCFN